MPLTVQVLVDMIGLSCPGARKEPAEAAEPVDIESSISEVPIRSGSLLPDPPRPPEASLSDPAQEGDVSHVSPDKSSPWESHTLAPQALSTRDVVQAEIPPSVFPDDPDSWHPNQPKLQGPQSLPSTPKKTPPPVKKKPPSLR